MSIGRAFAWPFRRLLDPRFGGLAKQADVQHRDLAERLDALNSRVADGDTIAEMFDAIRQELEELVAMPTRELAAIRRELTASARADMEANRETNELLARTLGDVLSEMTATRIALEGALGRDLQPERTEPDAAIPASGPNERIVELPYVYRALGGVEAGASVLDVGGAESALASSLASVGFYVTTVDLHPCAPSHPRVEAVKADILDWETDQRFDAVVCVSTLNHVEFGGHGEGPDGATNSTDRRAVERMHGLTHPGGLLVLTLPFGAPFGQRRYDRAGLDRLLAGWNVEDLTVVRREDSLTWVPEDSDRPDDAERVALVTARRPPE